MKKFRKSKLAFDQESEEWLDALILTSLRDDSGFDFIGSKLEISESKSNIYKGIISLKQEFIYSLFEAIGREIQIDLQIILFKIINRDINAFTDLLLKWIQIKRESHTNGFNLQKAFSTPITEDLKNLSQALHDYIESLIRLLKSRIINEEKIKTIIKDQSDAVNMLLSINRFLNLDVSKPHNLFDCSSLCFTSDNIKLLDCIFEFQTGKANEDHYACINESIIVAKHLYTSNQNNFMKNFSLSTEYQFLVMLTNSLFGNINCLGFCVDHILNGNKSLLCTLLCNYSIPEEQTCDNAILKSKEFKKRLIKNYYNFVKVCVEKTLGSRIAEYLHKFEIDKMLYMLLFGKLHNKDLIYEEMSNFTFLDSDVLEIFKSILTEETIPDLSLLIKKCLPFIMKNKQPLFSLNELLIKIDYFKGSDNMIPSGTMAQSLIVLKNKFKDQINERLLNDKYGFVIANNCIILDSAKLIKLILQCSTKNQDIIQDFIQMMLPLFENIPEAEDLLLILFQLSNLDYTRIFTVIPVIIKLMFSETMKKMIKSKVKEIDPTIISVASSILKSIVIMCYKNKYLFDVEYQEKIINNMLIEVRNFDMTKGVQRYYGDIEKILDFIMFIIGLERSHFEMMRKFANHIGCFDDKVQDLYNIFWKHKDTIFRNGVLNIPEFSKQFKSELINSTINIKVSDIKDEIKKAINNEMKDVVTIAKENVSDLSKAAKEQLKKVNKLAPKDLLIKNPIEVFGDIFKNYDSDNSGYIDFNEFEEFCKNVGFYMDKNKMLKLFSSADRDDDFHLDLHEFQYAILLLKIEIATDTLKRLGMTTEDLIWFGIMGLIMLLLLFAFIFFGISAFSKADVFNSIINSIMPIIAGVAVAARKLDLKDEIEKVKSFVEKILSEYRKKI